MTQSSSARVHVQRPEMAPPVSGAASRRDSSASTRAIPPQQEGRKGSAARNLVSLHVVEARDEIGSGWALTDSPPAAGDMWKQIAPHKGEAPNKIAWAFMTAAGLFRAVTVTGAWMVAFAVSTRTRAGVACIVLILITAAGVVTHTIQP